MYQYTSNNSQHLAWLSKIILLSNDGLLKDTAGNYEAAIEAYNEAIQLDPKNARIFNSRGSVKIKLGRYEEAIKDFDEAIRHDPKYIKAYNNRGFAKHALGRHDAAIEDYNKAIEANEALRLNTSPLSWLNFNGLNESEYALAFHNRGLAKKALGHYEAAVKDFDGAIKLNPKDAAFFSNRGIANLYLCRYEIALEDFNEAIDLNPKDAFAFYNRGIAKYELRRYEVAIEDFNQAIQLNDKDEDYFYYRGLAKYQLKHYEIAIKDFNETIRLNPEYALNFIEEAKDAIKQVLTTNSNYIPALKLQQQLPVLSSISKKKKMSDAEIMAKAENYFKEKKYQRAIYYYKKAVDRNCLDSKEKLQECERLLNLQQDKQEISKEFKYSEITLKEKLGEGGFGAVYKCEWDYTVYAIKKLEIDSLSAKESDNFHKEIRLMSQLKHPHIVSFYAACSEAGNHSIVMEYCEKGSLYKWLRTAEANNWPLRVRIGADIGKGLMYLHDTSGDKKEILHRDLKSHNVVLDKNLVAKITDFGLSKVMENTSRKNTTGGIKGTLRWIAPELINSREPVYSVKTDIYSYGMVLWEIDSRKEPYQEQQNEQIVGVWISQYQKERFSKNTPSWYEKLVDSCWSKELASRPSAKEVVKALVESNDYPRATISTLPSDEISEDIEKQLEEVLEQKRESQLSARFSAISIQPHLLPSSVKPAAAATNSMVLNELPLQSALPTSIQKPAASSTSLGGSRNNLYGGYIERFSATSLEARNKSRTTIGAVSEDVDRKNSLRP